MSEGYKKREKCSWPKHDMPTKESFQKDLCNWWIDYACKSGVYEEGYETISDILNALGRLQDYVTEDLEGGYGFNKELTPESRYKIISEVLRKTINSLIKYDKRRKK
tara:strand:+ start:183 stop:503 length:321 start_codon:yes stop_codon:yes gene_type:complete